MLVLVCNWLGSLLGWFACFDLSFEIVGVIVLAQCTWNLALEVCDYYGV